MKYSLFLIFHKNRLEIDYLGLNHLSHYNNFFFCKFYFLFLFQKLQIKEILVMLVIFWEYAAVIIYIINNSRVLFI